MAAATGTKQQQHPHPAPPPGAEVVDPELEWAEKAGSYVLRLTLTGFRKDDFSVQVDGAGRLTVRGTKPGASLHKVFQLPSAAILDDIAGRFEAGVLTLTMPKRAGVPKEEGAPKVTPTEHVDGDEKTGDADGNKVPKPAPSRDPTSIKEIKTKPKEEGIAKPLPRDLDDTTKMPAKDDGSGKKEAVVDAEPKESTFGRTTRQVVEYVQRMVEEANRRKQEQQKPRKEHEPKPKAPEAAAAAPTLEKLAPKLPSRDKAMVVVDRESLAESVRRRGEEERAKAAAMATAMEARAEQDNKPAATACNGWKERMTEGLGQLTDMKWADSAMEMARKNKEVVAVGIAAFSLGFFVSQRLFKK